MSENIRIDGTTIHIEGLPPIQITDNLEAWNAMSNQEKASYVSQLVQMLKPTQKARAAAQGATFGFSDEIHCRLYRLQWVERAKNTTIG